MTRDPVNPLTLPQDPAYSQAVVVREPAAMVYVGGQNAATAAGEIVGDDLAAQTTQALANVEAALTAAGATLHDVVRWTIAVVDGQPLQEGFGAFAQRWGDAVARRRSASISSPGWRTRVSRRDRRDRRHLGRAARGGPRRCRRDGPPRARVCGRGV